MKSPFPGMDPYLERHWGDVHQSLVIYARNQLQPRLPAPLRARVEERVFVEAEGLGRAFYPDVRVVEHPRPARPEMAAEGVAFADEPVVVRIESEAATEGFVEIVDVEAGNRVVTVIEFLSPTNKRRGEGRRLYLRKRREVLRGGASMVEIDLTRRGRRRLAAPPEAIPAAYRTTYQMCVTRGRAPERAEVYRAPLDRRLPTIRVPLRETDADVPLDLQALVDQAYADGRSDDLDYRTDPEPPLSPADAQWADRRLRETGRR